MVNAFNTAMSAKADGIARICAAPLTPLSCFKHQR
jgi:hypothetical protein